MPKGFILGPLLFLICVKDLTEGMNSYINWFAGDAKFMKEVKVIQDCITLQRDFVKLLHWFDA